MLTTLVLAMRGGATKSGGIVVAFRLELLLDGHLIDLSRPCQFTVQAMYQPDDQSHEPATKHTRFCEATTEQEVALPADLDSEGYLEL